MTLQSDIHKNNKSSSNYDTVSRNYDFSRRAGKADSALLVQLTAPLTSASVLEVGCGTGNYLSRIKNKPSITVGMDVSQKMLERARAKLPDAALTRSKAEFLPFSDRTFDAVYSIQVLHHVTDRNKFVSETFRILKPGGRFALQTCSHEQL